MASLQVYADDSLASTGDRRLFLAGYLNNAENWRLFSEAWAEELRYRPAIDYLRMVEAKSMRGQFRGWTEAARDEKLRGLARVARHFAPISFQFSVSTKDYSELVQPFAPRGLNPHFVCAFGTVAMISRYLASQNAKTKVDFIFDEQDGVSADIDLLFEQMKQSLPTKARNLINGTPIFRSDKEFLPLQSADMLAWHLRREHEIGDHRDMADLLCNPDGHLVQEEPQGQLRHWGEQFAQITKGADIQSKAKWQAARRELAADLAARAAARHQAKASLWKRLSSVFRK